MRAHSGALSNTAEISSTNLRAAPAFDNIKASWNQVLGRAERRVPRPRVLVRHTPCLYPAKAAQNVQNA